MGDDMDLGECRRVIGNYILGPRIGKGSFAVVWRSTHRHSGAEVAVKEIDKKHLTHTKVGENLLKEIAILANIRHPNIIRLFEAIEVNSPPLPKPRILRLPSSTSLSHWASFFVFLFL